MAENFNVDPYYDDFDPSKNYHRILFKPGAAVQARELTQSQTILQSQISKFADSIFSQNTPVTGGKTTINTGCYFVKLVTKYNDVNVVASTFLNKVITDSTGKVNAKVISAIESVSGDDPTLIVNYLTGGQFTDASIISDIENPSSATQTIGVEGGTTCTGAASTASIADGVFYVVNGYSKSDTQNEDGTYSTYSIGNFVSVTPQTIVLDKYSNTPSYRIGLAIYETSADYIDDSSLLDPAIGASNYQAPGADRYKITLTLTKLPLDLGNDDQFIELVRIENGIVQKQVDSTVYSTIDDYFAKRTKETNGDYIVNDFKIVPSANTINSEGFNINVGPGIAYVSGYRVENQSNLKISTNRARTTQSVNNKIDTMDFGNYLYVTGVHGANGGFFDAGTSTKVDLHSVPASSINTANGTTYTSTQVGTAYLRGLTYTPSIGETDGTSYVYKAHLFDVDTKVLSGAVASGSTANTVKFTATGGLVTNVANAYYGATVTIDSGPGQGDTRRIISYSGNIATVDYPWTVTPTTSSTYSLRFGTKDIEGVVVANSTYVITANATISDTYGKTGGLSTGDTQLLETGSNILIYPLGQPFVASVSDTSYTTVQEFKSQSFVTRTGGGSHKILASEFDTFLFIKTASGVESAESIKENFIVVNSTTGEIIDFTAAGRTVEVNSDNTVEFSAPDLSTFTATIFARVAVSNGNDTNSVLKTKTLKTANTTVVSGTSGTDIDGVYVDLTKGQIWIPTNTSSYGNPQKLYVSDVSEIVKIVDTNGVLPTSINSGVDVTTHYDFNNGQTDNYYGHAYISLKPGRPNPKSLWILFNYYDHSGGDGYFSASSYDSSTVGDRPEYTSSAGIKYSLKDCIDFRPAVLNAQSEFTFRYKDDPVTNITSLFLPCPGQPTFTTDFDYYLGRKDVLYIGKDKQIKLLQGTPAVNPLTPVAPEGSLVLANINVDPYTAYLPGDGSGHSTSVSVRPVMHKRWTFSDITNLQTRVNNLEYYAALNVLEQNANNLQIPDANGLNRFKNGILVDDFSTFGVGDTFNKDFSAAIDTIKQTLAPAAVVKNYGLRNRNLLNGDLSPTALSSLNYTPIRNGQSNFYMLNYTETELVKQPLASRTVNLNPFGVPNTVGVVTLTPPMDNWIDNTAEPDLLFVDPSIKLFKATDDYHVMEGNPTLSIGSWQSVAGTKYSVDDGSYTDTYEQRKNTWVEGKWSQSVTQSGDYITNVSIQPYIRSNQITFQSTGMLHNTTVNAFFDNKRVTRLIRKPNIIELTGVNQTADTFKIGDFIGFKDAGNILRISGQIIDVYHYTDTSTLRLYVVGDTYTSYGNTSNVVYNWKLSSAGGALSTGTSGAYGTITSTTHYSGKFATTVSNTTTVALNSKASSTDIYTGMEFWIVGGSTTGISSIANGKKATIQSYDTGTKTITLDIAVSFESGDIYSIGPIQTNEIGNVSGVFYLPGGYFHTGQRTFRLDNRVVVQTETEFIYNAGTETTSSEGIYYAQGLATKSQELDFAPSCSSAKNTKPLSDTTRQGTYMISHVADSHGGGGCCVIATALNNQGEWENSQKAGLIEWCEAKLHDKWWGETLRRGYQVIGSKVIVPNMENKMFRKYTKWQFGNATNMLRGKSFNPLSIPTALVWITAMVVTGAVVSKKFATKCWTSLYKK